MRDPSDRGLPADLDRLLERFASRRQVLKMLGAAALVPVVGCASDDPFDGNPACPAIPRETGGPFPANGANGPDALALSGIVRGDLRTSIGSASGTAEGVLLTVTLTLVDSAGDCEPLAGHAVYLWHCDRAGDYSMYTGDATDENYLRGVQESDASGSVSFTTIFPGCYPGRWPHLHFEVYRSLDAVTRKVSRLTTSQLALPEQACAEAYATPGYETSLACLADITFASDDVFRGATRQLAEATGDPDAGYAATLTVGVL
jgi:protocatechuate 3,4-dioxygenase beta subunit